MAQDNNHFTEEEFEQTRAAVAPFFDYMRASSPRKHTMRFDGVLSTGLAELVAAEIELWCSPGPEGREVVLDVRVEPVGTGKSYTVRAIPCKGAFTPTTEFFGRTIAAALEKKTRDYFEAERLYLNLAEGHAEAIISQFRGK